MLPIGLPQTRKGNLPIGVANDLLKHVGIQDAETAKWVDFFGPSGEVPNGDTIYGASHHRHV